MKRSFLIGMLLLFVCSGYSQNKLDFDVVIIQNAKEYPISDNDVKIKSDEFIVRLTMPAYMLDFKGEEYSSVNYVVTDNKSFFKSMLDRTCFKCGTDITPYAFDLHNSDESIVIGNTGFSYWTVSKDTDDHNVSSFKVVGNKIVADIKVAKFFLDSKQQNVSLKDYKGAIYLIFEAVNRESTKVGKKTFVRLHID